MGGREDPRITRIGGLLRRTRLDELPQLVNVIRGEMTMVGPRAEVPQFVDVYTPEQREVLSVPPGITGAGPARVRPPVRAAARRRGGSQPGLPRADPRAEARDRPRVRPPSLARRATSASWSAPRCSSWVATGTDRVGPRGGASSHRIALDEPTAPHKKARFRWTFGVVMGWRKSYGSRAIGRGRPRVRGNAKPRVGAYRRRTHWGQLCTTLAKTGTITSTTRGRCQRK